VQRRQAEEQARGDPGQDRREERSRQGEAERGAQHRAQLGEAHAQAALEEDERERRRSHLPGEVVVAELDPPGAVGPDDHPDREEEQQRGDPHPIGEQRGDERRGQQRAGDQDDERLGRHPAMSVA
jgi:hypothetical protein